MPSLTSLFATRRRLSSRISGAALLLFALLGVMLSGCAPSASNDPLTAMSINGTSVSLSSYQQLLTLFDASIALQGSGTASPIAWQTPGDRQTLTSAKTETINFFKNTTIIKQQLDAQHISVTQKDIDAAIAQLNAQISQARAQSVNNPTNTGLKALVDAATPDAIRLLGEQQAYTVVLAEKGSVPTVQARGILVNTQAQANDILSALKSGQDFATLARAHSLDAASAANGGDLGSIYPGEFIPAFDTHVFRDLKGKGYVVVPLSSGVGVFEVTGRGTAPLSAVKNSQTQQQYLTSWVTNVLMPQAQVNVYVS